MKSFPRTTVAGVSLPRMLIGSNWMLGFSHTSAAADTMIRCRYGENLAAYEEMFEAYLQYDINAIMAPINGGSAMYKAIKNAEQKTGKEIIMIDTPFINVSDSADARREAEAVIKNSAAIGCKFCLPHHAVVEQLVNKNKEEITRLPDYLAMIRDAGMIPGLSAHMPEIILYSDKNGYDVETYIQIYNCLGFLMQIEIETVARIIHNAKKPVMTIKAMAAGRCTPYVGITFSFATLRDCDMVTVGAHNPDEVHEDVEIAFAALERRYPDLEGRSSPVKNQSVLRK